jgi:DNA invertase Pin-like site-specific DNA recombinase
MRHELRGHPLEDAQIIRLSRERIEQENGTVIEIYADYAISGGSLRNRPRMQALLAAAKSGRFDCVIAEALDRVSRDQEDVAAIYKRLRHADVRLFTLAEEGDKRIACGPKRHDERAVPKGPRPENTPWSAGPSRSGQDSRR